MTVSEQVRQVLRRCRKEAGLLLSADYIVHRSMPGRLAAVALYFEGFAVLVYRSPSEPVVRMQVERCKPDTNYGFQSASLDWPWSQVCGKHVVVAHPVQRRPDGQFGGIRMELRDVVNGGAAWVEVHADVDGLHCEGSELPVTWEPSNDDSGQLEAITA